MKQLIFIIALCMCVQAFSQKSSRKMKTYKAGLKIGVNFSQVDGDGYGGFKKMGFTGGGFVNYQINSKSTLQGEILYSAKGSKSSFGTLKATGDYFEMNLGYVDIPLFYLYSFSRTFSVEAGIVPSVLIHSEELINGVSNATAFRPLDVSYLLGLNYRFSPTLSLTGRFCYSIFNIRKSKMRQPIHSIFGDGQYNQMVSFTIDYQFK